MHKTAQQYRNIMTVTVTIAIAGAKNITLTHLDEKPFLSLLYSPLGHDYTMIDFKGIIHAYVKEMNWKHFLHNLSFP